MRATSTKVAKNLFSVLLMGLAACPSPEPRCNVTDAAGLAALAAQGAVECNVSVDESQLDSLDGARGLVEVLGVTLTENTALTDIDLISDFEAPFTLAVADTPLAHEQTLPERVSTVRLQNTAVGILTLAGPTIDGLVLERNEGLLEIDGPQLTALGTVVLVDLPQLVLGDSFLAVTSCAALSVQRVPLATTDDIEALAQRCGLAVFDHCGNLDDAPCE